MKQLIISANGRLLSPFLIVLKEPSGTLVLEYKKPCLQTIFLLWPRNLIN